MLLKNTRIVFCDVGQGDATYIRIKNRFDVLIDSGPDRKVLACLGKYMPFYDRTIELFILSHPQQDHLGGLLSIIDSYKIRSIYTGKNIFPKKLDKIIKDKKIRKIYVDMNSVLTILNDRVKFVWPNSKTGKDRVCENDANCLSIIFLFQENNFKALFTGDTTANVLNSLAKIYREDIEDLNLLKVPHHGSKYGLNSYFLKIADPEVSVISVGKNNSYGHPTNEALSLLRAAKTKIKRTDKNGDIVIKLPLN